jgi:hypothetical protein
MKTLRNTLASGLAWLELATFDSARELFPPATGSGDGGSVRVLRVPESDDPRNVGRDFDAVLAS